MEKPVRIAFVITELEFGGAERCLANLVSRLDRKQFDPIVCSLKPRPIENKDSLVRQIENAAIPVHFLNLRSPLNFVSGMQHLKILLRQHQAEVVQTFLFHANVLGAFAASSAGISKIFSGIRVADPAWWRMRLERYALRRAQKIVCVSQSVADQVRSRGNYPSSKLCVIPNGVELKDSSSEVSIDLARLGLPDDRRFLVCVGRLHKQKGFDWLLELAPRMLQCLPGHDIAIVGEGPELAALEAIAARLAIRSRVHFLGWRPDVPELMRAAEVLLLPSRWEGMPNVLIEAMSLGTPVVATSVEGVDEVLGPLAKTEAVSPGNATAFIEAVCRVVRSPELREQLSRENRIRVQREFSLKGMIDSYEQLYLN